MGCRIDCNSPKREGLACEVCEGNRVYLEFAFMIGNSWYQVKVDPRLTFDPALRKTGMPIQVWKRPPLAA